MKKKSFMKELMEKWEAIFWKTLMLPLGHFSQRGKSGTEPPKVDGSSESRRECLVHLNSPEHLVQRY